MAGAAGAATNPNTVWQRLGLQSDGNGVSVTAGNTVKGTYTAIGTTGAAVCGFWLWVGEISNGTHRLLIDVFTDGVGTTVKIPNIAAFPGSGRWHRVWCPLAVAGSTDVGVKVQGTSGVTVRMYIQAATAASDLAPGFANAEAIVAADTTNTRPASNSFNCTTNNTTWAEIANPTSRTYGAVLWQIQATATPSPGSLPGNAAIATGAAASEAIFDDFPVRISTSNPLIAPFMQCALKSLASGSRLSARVLSSSAGAPDPYCAGAIGFYD